VHRVILFPVVQVEGELAGYLGLRGENERLRDELQRARLELSRVAAVRARNRELERQLGFDADQPVRLVAARVVNRDFSTLPTSFLIDVGRRDGVRLNAPVVTDEGLVGKTVEVGPGASRVMLFTHPDFSASALLVGGDHLEYGIVRPTPDGDLELYLPLRSASGPGARIVTSGYGGTFPRGIPLGEVVVIREDERLGLQKIGLVAPVVDLGRITTVFVLEKRGGDEGPPRDPNLRLFWPGYAYPPMIGDSLAGFERVPPSAGDSIPVGTP